MTVQKQELKILRTLTTFDKLKQTQGVFSREVLCSKFDFFSGTRWQFYFLCLHKNVFIPKLILKLGLVKTHINFSFFYF